MVMKCFSLAPIAHAFIIVLSTSLSLAASTPKHDQLGNFVQCLLNQYSPTSPSISNLIYTPNNSSYHSLLNSSLRNQRFSTQQTPKPLLIITPTHPSHIQATIICCQSHALQIRTRSGGHDFEGLSYVAYIPFVMIDLTNLRSISIDVNNKTAWVQSGATLGELYYRIGEKSRTLAFAAGTCTTVGVGGHVSGGGYGWLMRKYGLAADNVLDAHLVDADGKFHDRESMGEDLFWAIRGGGGGSFGIIVAWKLKLVKVPATITTCEANRTLEEHTMKLINNWQYVAHEFHENLLFGISLTGGNTTQKGGKTNPIATFTSLFLGNIDELLSILKSSFSTLGLAKEDCLETSWIESVLIKAGIQKEQPFEALLNRANLFNESSKIKSDFVKQPISKAALKGLWEKLKSQDIELAQVMFIPYGGRMSEISELETPFPYRAQILYKLGYVVKWKELSIDAEKRHLNWIRDAYDYMTPFVSKSPRATYVNYRDLDIGTNDQHGNTSYDRASIWGLKYFGKNFDRLVHVKSKIDPSNFFRHEQSIPTLYPLKFSPI